VTDKENARLREVLAIVAKILREPAHMKKAAAGMAQRGRRAGKPD
jgi:hypothetical protein